MAFLLWSISKTIARIVLHFHSPFTFVALMTLRECFEILSGSPGEFRFRLHLRFLAVLVPVIKISASEKRTETRAMGQRRKNLSLITF